MLEFWNPTPMIRWSDGYEHLHEVNKCEEEAERQHGQEEKFLISSHVPHVVKNGLQHIRIVGFLLFFIWYLQTNIKTK